MFDFAVRRIFHCYFVANRRRTEDARLARHRENFAGDQPPAERKMRGCETAAQYRFLNRLSAAGAGAYRAPMTEKTHDTVPARLASFHAEFH